MLRGGLVGCCSALVTALAHAAGGGGVPSGSALVEMLVVCATVGAGVGAVDVAGRHAKVGLVIAALGAGQALGHLVLTAVAGHDHSGSALATPGQMVAFHTIAAIALGLLIVAVEYLYVVTSAVVTWLRLFATVALAPTVTCVRHYANVVVVQSVLLRTGLGMRAPPRRACLGV
jgi:hypothetical protein